MKVTMIGTGYVGLVSGVCFAELGHDVTCVDIRPEIIEKLNHGESPIYEPGLSELITKNIKAGSIKFSTNYDSVKNAKVVFLGVGTPSADNGEANLDYLQQAALSVAKEISDETIIVIKSTVPVGTSSKFRTYIGENTKKKFYLVNNPEFLKEGSAIDDFMRPDRVVIGYKEKYAAEVMEELYAPLVRQGNPIFLMSNLSAEMTKYAANAMLAVKISFINDIAKLCDASGADVEEVRKGISSDRRIGPHFIYAGPGYGGSCFPKDVKALIHTGREFGIELELAKAAESVNDAQKVYMFTKMKRHFRNELKGRTFAFWGVAFKPNTDDIRESPAISMAKALVREGAQVQFYDPEGAKHFHELMESNVETKGKTKIITNKYDCINGTDGLVLMTEWSEFRAPDFAEIKLRLKTPVLFDARNLYKRSKVKNVGMEYYAIGKTLEE